MIGTGYVGLVSGACFAEAGNEVVCVDVDTEKIDRLNRGDLPIYEPGLAPMVVFNRSEGRLRFTTDLATALNEADVSFVAVGTPANEDGSADLTHVLNVADEIARAAKKQIVLGTKSTVPVGTGDKIESLFREKLKHPFVVFSNPEFLKEGNAVNDFLKPDRIVIGADDPSVVPLLRELYSPFTRKSERVLVMSRKSAELTKYAANAMLATRISFMNEMANLCEKVGANINEIRMGIGSDPRIGPGFLFAGIGFGGSCFPKDIRALLKTASDAGERLSVIDSVAKTNQRQKEVLFEKIVSHYGGRDKLKGLKMALWGLAFKAKTDDIRESPSLTLVDRLLEAGVEISAYDPHAEENARHLYGTKITLHEKSYDCLNKAAGLVVATDWNEFRSPDYPRMKSLMSGAVIFDGRNILNRSHLEELGFTYYGIGV